MPEADATRGLYERYGDQIFGYCLHQLGSREEAEDAVQSTFLNAFRGLKRGVVPEQESAWLFKIANNVCLSRRRSTWRRGRVESPADFGVVEELAPAPSRVADELIGLEDVLEQMPENQRRAILLREWQGLSYREISSELELSQSAVETLIFRARRSLAQGLRQSPAEQRSGRARALPSLSLGGLVTALKSLLIGGTAAKVAGAVAVVAVSSFVATSPPDHHPVSAPKASVPPRAKVAAAATVGVPAGKRSAPVSVAPARPLQAAPMRHATSIARRAIPAQRRARAARPAAASRKLARVAVPPAQEAPPVQQSPQLSQPAASQPASSAPEQTPSADQGRSGPNAQDEATKNDSGRPASASPGRSNGTKDDHGKPGPVATGPAPVSPSDARADQPVQPTQAPAAAPPAADTKNRMGHDHGTRQTRPSQTQVPAAPPAASPTPAPAPASGGNGDGQSGDHGQG